MKTFQKSIKTKQNLLFLGKGQNFETIEAGDQILIEVKEV